MTAGSVPVAASVLAVAVAGAAFASLWRRRSDAASRALSWVGATLVSGTLAHLALARPAVAGAPGPPADGIPTWIVGVYDTTVVAVGLWFVFVVDYTGRGRRAATAARLVTAAVATLLGAATTAVLAGVETPLVGAVLATAGVVGVGLGLVGVALLLDEASRRTAVPGRGAVALSAGAVALSLTPVVASVSGVSLVVPAGLGVASLALWGGVARYPTLERPPAARVVGRDAALDGVADAVVVVDDGTVVDCNAAAERVFDVDRSAVRGGPRSALSSSLPPAAALRERDAPLAVTTADGVALEVTADDVTDARGRRVGAVLVCRPVTDRRERERRVSLLTRLLADIVRDEAAAVADDAAGLRTGDGDPAAVGSRVRTRVGALRDLVGTARTVERALEDGTGTPADAGAVAAAVVENRPGVTVDRPAGQVPTGVPAPVLESVLAAVVTTAAAPAVGDGATDPGDRTTGGDRSARRSAPTRVAVEPDPPTVRVAPAAGDENHPAVRLANAVLSPAGAASVEGSGGDRTVTVELPPADGSRATVDDGVAPTRDGGRDGGGSRSGDGDPDPDAGRGPDSDPDRGRDPGPDQDRDHDHGRDRGGRSTDAGGESR